MPEVIPSPEFKKMISENVGDRVVILKNETFPPQEITCICGAEAYKELESLLKAVKEKKRLASPPVVSTVTKA